MSQCKPLPTLNLQKMHAKAEAAKATARHHGEHKPQPPPGHRRGYGFSGIMAPDAVPQTSRPTRSRDGNNKAHTKQNNGHAKQQQPLTARIPIRDKTNGGRPTSKRQLVRHSPGKSRPEDNPASSGETPMTPAQALKTQRQCLVPYEQGEILDYPEVWFLAPKAQKIESSKSSEADNHGYDDERGDYRIVLHDHLAYRFEVLSPLGKGSFGQVCKCFDYKKNSIAAVKLIRNKKRFHHQALVEVKLLQYIKERDPHDQANIVHMSEYFYFRNHLCIAFEVLSINLYELIKNNNFQGLSLGLIRRFAVQMLTSLRALRKLRIIHCDLKPENVLLRQPNKSGIKIIDFGSSCFENERVYTYMQSRFYRSPEVILGLPYDTGIDMWSFGCILAELYTGYPLFPGENEMEQLACIMQVFGPPPKEIVDISNRKMFFDSQGNPRIVPNSRGKKRRPSTKDLATTMSCNDKSFVSFLKGCLKWDPRCRFTPEDAIQHEWVLEGLQGQQGVIKTSRNGSRSSNGSNDKGPLPTIGGKSQRKEEHVRYFG